jgi:hypothetical protein
MAILKHKSTDFIALKLKKTSGALLAKDPRTIR